MSVIRQQTYSEAKQDAANMTKEASASDKVKDGIGFRSAIRRFSVELCIWYMEVIIMRD